MGRDLVGLSVEQSRSTVDGELLSIRVGHPVLDEYLEFVAARARPNTALATAYDLKVFFGTVAKEPKDVTTADVLKFIAAQREPRLGPKVVRLEDAERGLSARTIKRRLTTVSGLYTYLIVKGDGGVADNPVPRGLAARRARPHGLHGTPLIRTPRTLPRVLEPTEVDAFMAALRTNRDRAMAEAMVLGGLRRCEVLGLRHEGLNRRVRLIVNRAYGFHSANAALGLIMLTLGPIEHVLPHERRRGSDP